MNQDDWEKSIAWARIVAACIIKQDGKYLMVQEEQAKAYGLWNLPAGHVEKDETIEEAAIREVKEETGFSVRLTEKVAVLHEHLDASVKHVFRAEIIGGELTPQKGEILDARWLTYEEISVLNDDGKIRAPWVWNTIQNDYQNQ